MVSCVLPCGSFCRQDGSLQAAEGLVFEAAAGLLVEQVDQQDGPLFAIRLQIDDFKPTSEYLSTIDKYTRTAIKVDNNRWRVI
jgi:hypothetical protein